MTSPDVQITVKGDLLTIELSRAQAGNALNLSMCEAIVNALTGLADHIKVVKLCAQGEHFCTGRDSPMPGLGPHPSGEKIRTTVALPPLSLYDAVKNCPVPVLCLVQGHAFGAGCALACVCDMTFASEGAWFEVNEMDRDIPPTLVMTALLGKVPIKTLAHLVLSREKISSMEAYEVGLIRKVVPPDQLNALGEQLIEKMLTNSAVSLRAVKQFLTFAPEMSSVAFSNYAGHLAGTALSTKF
jgi:enoyl-CoA hydratase